MSTSQFKSNVTKIDDAVFKITGARANYFRFVRYSALGCLTAQPYGAYNTQRLQDLYSLGIKRALSESASAL